MGQGQSQLKEELAAVTKRLEEATNENKKLQGANAELTSQVTAATETVTQAQRDAAAAELSCTEQLAAKESEVLKAVKERELAVELRRSDSLLAKRIMTAQMRRAGEKETQAYGGFEGSTMAAQLALAAQDEMQLRQVPPPPAPFHIPLLPAPVSPLPGPNGPAPPKATRASARADAQTVRQRRSQRQPLSLPACPPETAGAVPAARRRARAAANALTKNNAGPEAGADGRRGGVADQGGVVLLQARGVGAAPARLLREAPGLHRAPEPPQRGLARRQPLPLLPSTQRMLGRQG